MKSAIQMNVESNDLIMLKMSVQYYDKDSSTWK